MAPPLHYLTSQMQTFRSLRLRQCPGSAGEQWGALAHNRQQTSHSIYSEVIPEVHATVFWRISACTYYVFDIQLLTEKAIIASYPFKLPKKARRTRVFKRGCSVLSFSPALLVIQCRTLMNTIRCSPGNSAWIYFHQIEQHLMIPHHIQIGKPKANFFKKISLSLNFHRNI